MELNIYLLPFKHLKVISLIVFLYLYLLSIGLLSILYHISQLASESKLTLPSDCLQRLFLLLISFLRYSGNHDNVFDFYKRLIEAICSLIPFVTDYHEGIKQLCLLLYPNKYCIKEVVIRRKLLQCFETMLSQITGFEQVLFFFLSSIL